MWGVYYAFTKFMLWYGKAEFSAYRGINNLSLPLMIKSLPGSVKNCYSAFYNFFAEDYMSMNTAITKYALTVFFIFLTGKLLYSVIRSIRQNVFSGLMMLLAVLLMPVACNASILLAVGQMPNLLMSMGMMYVAALPVLLRTEGKGWLPFWDKRVGALVLAVMLWLSASVVENDQLALKEGITATVSLVETLVDELMDQGYLADGTHAVVFLGRPADSPLFYQSAAFQLSNPYAKFGYFRVEAGNNRRTWRGVLNILCGRKIFYAEEEAYNAVRESVEAADMPVFPKSGSVKVIGNIIVIKIGEPY